MEFQQYYLNCLAHASYLVGSEGVAAVVDPQRDVDLYIEDASARNLRITHVIETHLHADFVSGHVELARRTGAEICIGWRAGAEFPHRAVHDGDTIRLGKLTLEFLETPGHTPEGICILITDHERSEKPHAVLTGDTLFIGDVGRPDLSPNHSPRELAGMLYDSLRSRILTLDDDVIVYPAHGAGSLCGRQMSAELSSTIGVQRRSNYALLAPGRDEFIALLTTDLPERPGYFSRDAAINRAGAAALEALPALAELDPPEFEKLRAGGCTVLDVRPPEKFLNAHIPGAVHIGLGGQFASWAGTVFGVDASLLIVAEDPESASQARLRLARVGIERVEGSLAGGMPAWEQAGLPMAGIPSVTAAELRALCDAGRQPLVIDVRRAGEWQAGHLPGATLLPLQQIASGLPDLDPSQPLVVHCQGGYRSVIAASLLRRMGFEDVRNVIGGFEAWKLCGLPVEK